MINTRKSSARRWFGSAILCAAASIAGVSVAEANSLYWRNYNPSHLGPGPVFISPSGTIWNGGWWMSVDVGRAPISICRISDGPVWSYGSFYNGMCNYYSPALNHAHSVSVGFDLMGGSRFPRWRPVSDHHRDAHVSDTGLHFLGEPTVVQQTVQNSELGSLCRIQEAEGAFVGTVREGTCFAAWNGQLLISADYEIPELTEMP